MNQEVLDYITTSAGSCPRAWSMDDIFHEVAAGGKSILVAGPERWAERQQEEFHRKLDEIQLHAAVTEHRRHVITFRDGSRINFISSSSRIPFMGHRWDVAFISLYEAALASPLGSMPVWQIPAQADWHDVSDAVEDATEFLRTHEGEVEFDFQGNRYKVPYGCDYCVMVGSVMPGIPINFRGGLLSSDADPGATSTSSYAGISRSTGGVATNADQNQLTISDLDALTNNYISHRVIDEVFRDSLTFTRLRGGSEMRNPIQFALPDPMALPDVDTDGSPYWHGRRPYVHLSDIATYSGAIMDPGPSARELDLQRRLDTVRECVVTMPNPIELRDPAMAQRLMEALNYPLAPVQDLDSYVYRYEFVNGQALKVNDKLSCGTILDAAARPVRKFRLVEE